MISTVNICNMALSKIGQPQITGLEENSQAARHCRNHFDLDRDSVLSSFPWTFATHVEKLVRVLMNSPLPGFAYAYKKPPDALRLIRLINPDASISKINANEAQIENYREISHDDMSLILSNIAGALIEYISRVTDPALWDSLFCEALVLKLAGSLASAISGSGQRTAEFNALYEQSLLRGKIANANNDSPPVRSPTTLRDSRR